MPTKISQLPSGQVVGTIAPTAAASSTAGNAAKVRGSDATAGSSVAGAATGGDATVQAGDAKRLTSGDANGGNVNLTVGAGIGAGTSGQVNITDAGALAAPAITLAGDTAVGWYRNASNNWTFTTGVARLTLAGSSTRLGSAGVFGWSSVSNSTTTADTGLARNAAAVAEVNNGTAGTYGQLAISGTQGNATLKALTESSATVFVKISVPTGSRMGGFIEYAIEANDAADFQVRSGIIPFAAVNKAGTITATIGTVTTATEVVAVSAGTLTNTFTVADAGSGVLNILANAVSSLTQTTLQIRYKTHISGTGTVTPQ